MVLGIIGRLAWRYAGGTISSDSIIGDALVVLATTIWALLMIAFIARAVIRFPWSVRRQEMRHPVASSFVSLIGDNAIGVDRFCWLASPVVAGVICCGGYAAALLCGLAERRVVAGKHPGRRRPVYICRPSPTIYPAPWPAAR